MIGGDMLDRRYQTTGQVNFETRLEYWSAALRESIYELQFEARDSSFEGELRQHSLGPLRLSEVAINTGHAVTRSRRAISRSQISRFNLNYVKSGEFTVAQGGQEVTLTSGDFILLDSRRPYRVASSEKTVHLCLHFPIEWLRHWLPYPEEFVARPIRHGMRWTAALAASLNDAHLFADTPDGMTGLCADQIAGALALVMGPARSAKIAHCRKLYVRLQEVLAEMACDPELDARKVADALSISTRYLYKILARENTTYSRELLRIRLECSGRMLRDRRFDDLSIAEIAWRSGFRDPSHFSKRFRQAFERTPGALRNASHCS
jgi:AraC family transcriptional regulator, positive regulator of tynA and feaB